MPPPTSRILLLYRYTHRQTQHFPSTCHRGLEPSLSSTCQCLTPGSISGLGLTCAKVARSSSSGRAPLQRRVFAVSPQISSPHPSPALCQPASYSAGYSEPRGAQDGPGSSSGPPPCPCSGIASKALGASSPPAPVAPGPLWGMETGPFCYLLLQDWLTPTSTPSRSLAASLGKTLGQQPRIPGPLHQEQQRSGREVGSLSTAQWPHGLVESPSLSCFGI